MFKKKLLVLLSFIIVSPIIIQAQTFEETIGYLSSAAAEKYVEPVITAFGSNLNAGWVNFVPQPKLAGFDLNIKIVGMGTFLNNKAKTFSTEGVFNFNSDQADAILKNSGITSSNPNYESVKQALLSKKWPVSFSGPTIIGKKSESLKIYFAGDETLGLESYTETIADVKGLLDETPILPMGAPQITLGTLFGTSVSFRYFPSIEIDNLGKFQFYGFGVMHNPGVWFNNPLPVDIGIGFFSQKMKIGSVLESNAIQYGIFVSKTIGTVVALIPYAGVTMESSKTTINYEFEYESYTNGNLGKYKDKISLELEGENTSAFIFGTTIKLALLNLNIDYKMAKYKTLSAGVSFEF